MRQVALIMAWLSLGLFLVGCAGEEEGPEAVFEQYIKRWMDGEYEAMYDLLSQDSQAAYDRELISERYENIYSGIEARNLEVTAHYPEEIQPDDQGRVHLPFTVSVESMAGPIQYEHTVTLIQEEDGESGETKWAIEWGPDMIFPQLEAEDKVRVEVQEARRGELLDRHGEGLAINGQLASVGLVPAKLYEAEDPEQVLEQLAEELHLSMERIEEALNAPWVQPDWFVPLAVIAKDDEAKKERLLAIPGVMIQDTPGRVYPYREAAAHISGYLQPVSAEEWPELKERGYRQTDLVGKAGLEQVFEERLRGEHGATIYTVDADNNRKETIAHKAPADGEDIRLTIDLSLQQEVYRQLAGDRGAALALNPQTGEILALASSPAYDPNQFILGLSAEAWQQYAEDPEGPLFNRFNQAYPPGSVFKPLTAALAVETGVLNPEEKIEIKGKRWQPDPSWGQYHITRVTDPGHPLNLKEALLYSDNIYFAQAALKLGREAFVQGLERFGFGQPLPIDLPVASSTFGQEAVEWDDLQLAVSSFGQGEVLMSPLHLALVYAAFLNQGQLIQPKMERDELEEEKKIWLEQVISPESAELIKEALIQAVDHPQGTGHQARLEGWTIGGKTGTAELKASQDEQGEELGWFVGFEAEEGSILVVMMIEGVEDKGGSRYVVPKVKEILKAYLER